MNIEDFHLNFEIENDGNWKIKTFTFYIYNIF